MRLIEERVDIGIDRYGSSRNVSSKSVLELISGERARRQMMGPIFERDVRDRVTVAREAIAASYVDRAGGWRLARPAQGVKVPWV